MSRKYRRLREFRPRRRDSRAGYTAELTIDSLADDGRGIARHRGKVVFVADALPGEAVRVEVLRQHRRYDEGRVLEVLSASPQRREPPCEYYGRCGGCQLQHLDYRGQVAFKQERLAALLQRLGADIELAPPILGDEWHYRHRGRFAFDAAGGEVTLGFRQRASHDLVEVAHCPLLEEGINAELASIGEALRPLLKACRSGELVVAADARDRLAVAVDAARKPSPALCREVAQRLDSAGLAAVTCGGEEIWIDKNLNTLFYQLDNNGTSLEFSPLDFTQVNPSVNRRMIAQALAWLAPQPGETLADYYAGLGNFTLPLAKAGARIRAYEVDAAMVARGAANADAADLPDIDFVAGDLQSPTPAMVDGIDKALLDPPRAGARAMCEALAHSAIGTVLYVSCDPATLERDLVILQDGGFRVTRAGLIDMFPHSYHLEAMVQLSR